MGLPPSVRRPQSSLDAASICPTRQKAYSSPPTVTFAPYIFAGSLAQGHRDAWPGLIAGVACAALAYAAVAALFDRARRRLESGAAGLLDLYADGVALALAGLAIALPPAGLVALIAFAVLVVRSRGGRDSKYEGLRVLR